MLVKTKKDVLIYRKESDAVFEAIKAVRAGKQSNVLYQTLDQYLSLDILTEEKFRAWIKNVPHFVGHLWEEREIYYIARFNEMAFIGANYLNLVDNDGCLSLVDLFMKYATWKDSPSDFGLSEKSLKWLKSNCFQVVFIWIKAAPFLMESDFIKFKKINLTK